MKIKKKNNFCLVSQYHVGMLVYIISLKESLNSDCQQLHKHQQNEH